MSSCVTGLPSLGAGVGEGWATGVAVDEGTVVGVPVAVSVGVPVAVSVGASVAACVGVSVAAWVGASVATSVAICVATSVGGLGHDGLRGGHRLLDGGRRILRERAHGDAQRRVDAGSEQDLLERKAGHVPLEIGSAAGLLERCFLPHAAVQR